MKPITVITPFLKAPRRIRTLGDALASIIFNWSCLPRELRKKNYDPVYRQRRVGEFLSEILGAEEKSIPLVQVVDMEGDVIRHALDRGLSRQDSVQYGCDLHKILAHARKRGWGCPAMAVREAWQPIQAAFHPETEGCLQIIEYLISRGLKPDRTRESHINAWKKSAMAAGLSEEAADDRVKRFRRKIRRAGLAHLVPHLDLQLNRLPSFILGRNEIPAAIGIELAEILNFKTADWIAGRRYEIAVSACTARILYKRFRQLLGFVVHILGITDIESLLQVVTEPIISKYIGYLEQDRSLLRESIGHLILPIHAVVREHRLFRDRDYGWMLALLKKVPSEVPQKRQERKEKKFVPYSILATIPTKLRALSRRPGLTAIEVAWYRHDELFWLLLLHLPLRLRNLRECGIKAPANKNLVHEKINPRMQIDLKLPDWVQAALKSNPAQKFWLFKFNENAMKARRAETKFVDPPVVRLLVDYLAVHRSHLVQPGQDPGTLFLGRRGKALSEIAARRIVTHWSRTLAKRITPHLIRDVVSDHTLKHGGTIEDVQDKLCQIDFETSWIYSKVNNSERGIDALNQHFSSSGYSNLT